MFYNVRFAIKTSFIEKHIMKKIVQTPIVSKCKDVILMSVLSFFFYFHEGFCLQREKVSYFKMFAQMEVHTHVNPKGSGSRLIGLPILVSV